MLTLKQKKLLDYIVQYCSSNKIYPTFDEMRSYLNIKSKSGIHKLLSSLEDKGIIERLPHKARALKLKKVINLPKSDERSLPFLGRIAAGNPIEAITGSFEQISVPNYLINGKDEHFTLEVTGDSMIEDGINDGDELLVTHTDPLSPDLDEDGDGFRWFDDCDDNDSSRSPNVNETWNWIDDDCDNVIDNGIEISDYIQWSINPI